MNKTILGPDLGHKLIYLVIEQATSREKNAETSCLVINLQTASFRLRCR